MSAPLKPADAVSTLRLAQIGQLIKDNQLITALVVFLLWQGGAIAQGMGYIGGMC